MFTKAWRHWREQTSDVATGAPIEEFFVASA
jgi:hypothetical protein